MVLTAEKLIMGELEVSLGDIVEVRWNNVEPTERLYDCTMRMVMDTPEDLEDLRDWIRNDPSITSVRVVGSAKDNPVLAREVRDRNKVLQTMQKITQFQTVVRNTLREGHDYGSIPGTGSKPILLKPGAEKIM